jgi:tetratricopeptide (TPR) repeat protein
MQWCAQFSRFVRARPLRTAIIGIAVLVLGGGAVFGLAHLRASQHFRDAERLMEEQRFAQAHAHYVECLRTWPTSAATHLAAGTAARKAALYDEAEQHLSAAEKLLGAAASSSVPLALERLLLRAQTGEVREVEGPLLSFVQKGRPETPLVLEALARGYLRMRRLVDAMQAAESLLRQQPDNIEALLVRAWVREGSSENEQAARDYRRALELVAERDDIRLSLGRALLRDHPREARTQFEAVLARQPENVDALVGAGEAYQADGQPDKALPLFESAVALAPNHSRALTGLAVVASRGKGPSEVEGLLRRAIAADGGNKDAHYQLYLCLVQQPNRKTEADAQRKTYEGVVADLTRLTEIAAKDLARRPHDPDLYSEMGSIYLRLGRPEVGLRWLSIALKLDAAHQRTHRALYEHFQRTGQVEQAERHRRELRP